ncbi:Nuclear mitotic apparatus protein 1-like [Homarus americanus]|uniref:Nuclear mitotic apparatus protein 1-like n=1 Tax=Homarus americanus TaxID=6706 RepID=A0A8J5JKA3_HOMAM|nr:Nuclear mitotic apparatus protein 1-like [Homarus americanus]
MEEEAVENIILKCVNALELLPEQTPAIKHLVDGRVYGRLLTILKNEDVKKSDLVGLIPDLQAIIKDHFAGPNLIIFEDVASGNQTEVTKLTLLLLYIMMVTESKLRSRLLSSPLMDQSTQIKVKYLIESIQKRGSGMSTKFLNILCTEKLGYKGISTQCQTPIYTNAPWGSPKVYYSSPKASPLRDLVYSPPFRMQKLLNTKTREVKQLQQQIHNMENDKQEIEVSLENSHKKISKLKDELVKTQKELQDLLRSRDELETKMVTGEDLVQQQVHRLGKEAAHLRKENASLQQTVNMVMETNDELTTKNESLSKRLMLVSAERDRQQEEMSTLYMAKLENENIIESQAYHMKDMKIQLEDLRQCLLEQKPSNHAIEESFEVDSPMIFTDAPSPSNFSPGTSGPSGENMADAVVDKILFETQEQLNHLQEQHASLQEKLSETTYNRDQLLAQVECLITENESTVSELGEARETYEQLYSTHAKVCEEQKNNLQLLQEAQVKNQMAEVEQKKLEAEAHETSVTVWNMKAELTKFEAQLSECSAQLKDLEEQLHSSQSQEQVTRAALEKESKERLSLKEEFSTTVSKMNGDFQQKITSLTEEHNQKLEIQNLILSHKGAELQMVEDSETMVNEKAALNMQLEIKSEALCALQQEMDNKQKVMNEEQSNLEKEVQMKNSEYLKLQNEMEAYIEQATAEKATLNEEMYTKEKAYSSIQQRLEITAKSLVDLKASFDEKLKVKDEALLTVQQEKENKSEILSKEISSLKDIIKTNEIDFSRKIEEMDKTIKHLNETKAEMSKELQLQEDSIATQKQEMEDDLIKFADEKKELNAVIIQKESAYSLLQQKLQEAGNNFMQEKNALMNEIQTKEGYFSEIKKEFEMTIELHAQEKLRLDEAIKTKEEELASSQKLKETTAAQQDMRGTLEILSKEKLILTKNIKEKEEALNSLQLKYLEAEFKFSSEKATFCQDLSAKELTINSLQKEIEKIKNEHATSVKLMNEELEQTRSSFEGQQNANNDMKGEIEALKGEISSKVAEHNNILAETRNEISSNIHHLSTLISEKDGMIKSLEEEKEESIQIYKNKIQELDMKLGEKCKHLNLVEQENLDIKINREKKEALLREDLNNIKLELELLQKEKEEQVHTTEKIIVELKTSLKDKMDIITTMKEENEQNLLSHKTQINEMEAKIADLQSIISVKEETFRNKISLLKGHMANVEADNVQNESKVVEVTAVVNKMEQEHTVTLDHLKMEAEQQQVKFDADVLLLKERLSSLKTEKMKIVCDLEEKNDAMNSLTLELNGKVEALQTAEKEKEKVLEALELERASMNDVIKAQEDALNTLQQQVEKTLEAHIKEKAVLMEEIKERGTAFASLQEEMKNHLTRCDEEKASLSRKMQGNEEVVINQQQQIETLLAQVSEEKEVKESVCTNLNRELQEKEELLTRLQKERENYTEMHLAMNDAVKEKERDLSSLQLRLQDITDAFTFEKESLLKELEVQKENYVPLKNNFEKEQEKLTADITMLTLQIQEKENERSNLQEEIKEIQEKNAIKIKTLEGDLEKITTCLEAEKKLNNERESELMTLKEEIVQKNSEHSRDMTETQELFKEISRLNECIAKRKQLYETLQKQIDEETERNKTEMLRLQGDITEKGQVVEALEQEIVKMKKNHENTVQEMNNDKTSCVNFLKAEMSELHKTYIQKEKDLSEELNHLRITLDMMKEKTVEQNEIDEVTFTSLNECLAEKSNIICALKEDIEQVRLEHETLLTQMEQRHVKLQKNDGEKIVDLNVLLAEKSEAISTMKGELEDIHSQYEVKISRINKLMEEQQAKMASALSSLENKIEVLESEKIVMSSKFEEHEKTFVAQISTLEEDLQSKETICQSSIQELKTAQEEIKKYKVRIQTLEAKLIDNEQQISAAKEETMRVERESEKSTRSLSEEVKAIKEKARSEKKAVADRMKMSYRTEVEKLMIQIEEKEQEGKEKEKILQKYEVAKKKLAEVLTNLNETKTTNEHYEKQMAKYKEHVKKLEGNLQKELFRQNEMKTRITELDGRNQPLEEKLHEYENTIKRFGNEKRSLEVQLHHAEAQMKEMKKQFERDTFNEGNLLASTFTRGRCSTVSDSQISEIRMTRTSASSAESDWDVNDSQQQLLQKKPSKETFKKIPRATSAETVTRKPCTRTSGAENKQRCENQARQNAAATEKKVLQQPETSISGKSFGRSVPRDMLFNCEDEEMMFSNKYLLDMQLGKCNPMDEAQWKRVSELQRRNSLYPPHMRSAYPAEMQSIPLEGFADDKLREGHAVNDRQLMTLTQATENLGLDSPAFNLRKRKSLSDSIQSEASFDSSGGKRTKRLSTSYSRPGPPTPGRKGMGRVDKENRRESSASELSLSSITCRGRKGSPQSTCSGGSPVSSRVRQVKGAHSSRSTNSPSSRSVRSASSPSTRSTRSPGNVTVLSKKGATPRARLGMTPASLRRILSKGKSPWKKLNNEQETPKGLGDSTDSNGRSKLRIFRRPFGSRNYNVLSASLRSQENPQDLNNSLTVSIGRSDPTIVEKKSRMRR